MKSGLSLKFAAIGVKKAAMNALLTMKTENGCALFANRDYMKNNLSLKHCPFCGGKEIYMQNETFGYAVACVCGASGPAIDDDEDIDHAEILSQMMWNKRYLEPR